MKTICRQSTRLAAIAILALLTTALVGPASAQDSLMIGVTAPLSGPAAQSGLALRQGMIIAADEWNAKGGVTLGGKHRKVELLVEDNQGDPAQGVSAAQKLITSNKVNFLIGDAFASSVTMAEMDLADQYKIPMMSCEPVSGAISEKIEKDPQKYRYFWKGDYNSDGYATTLYGTYISLMKSGQVKPVKKTIAFLVEDTDYGRSIASDTINRFKADGWNIIANNTVPLGSTNFNAVLAKLSYANPDVLVSVFTSVDSGVALSKQFQEQGMKSMQMAIFYPLRPAYYKGAGNAGDGLVWAPLVWDPAQRPNQKPLAEKVQAKFNTPGTSDHAFGYDCVNIILEAYKTAGSLKTDSVVKALAATNHNGIQGRYVFDQKNHTVKFGPGFIVMPAAQIRNGKNILIWPEDLATGKYETPRWMK